MSKLRKIINLDRTGEFRVKTTGDAHCGTLTNQVLAVKYTLHCECEVVLDKRGFLFDQINVERYFKKKRRTTLSCEKLTMACAKELATLIRKDNPTCQIRKMQLTLSPWPHSATMTYTVESVK